MATCDPQALLNAANCFDCLTNQQLEQVQVQMLCDFVNSGFAGGPFVRISGDTMTGGLFTPTLQSNRIGIGVVPSVDNELYIAGTVNVSPAMGHNAISTFENIVGGTTAFSRGAYLGMFIGDTGAINYNILEGCAKEVYLGVDSNLGVATNWTGTATIVTGSNNFVRNSSLGAGIITEGIGEWSRVTCGATGIIRKAIGNRISSIQAIGADGAAAHLAIGIEIQNSITATGGLTNLTYAIYDASTSQSYHEGSMGFGTQAPLSKVDVNGSLAVGTSYAGAVAAPANGAIIEGKVGVGTNSPDTGLTSAYASVVHCESSSAYAALACRSTSSASGAFFELDNDQNANNYGLLFGTYGSTNGGGALWGVARANNSFMFKNGSAELVIGTVGAGNITIGTNLTARMTFLGTGPIGIGTVSPSANALLDLVSTTQGFKLPTMTTAQKNAIANTAGLMVFDTDLGKACVNTGAAWQTITSA